jgi:hypothetical protein
MGLAIDEAGDDSDYVDENDEDDEATSTVDPEMRKLQQERDFERVRV